MAQKYNAGNVPYGSRVVTPLTAAGAALSPTTWKLENININRPGRVINRPDELGAPNGWVLDEDQETGTCTAQIATAGQTDYPALGHNFTEDFGGTDTTEKWVVVGVGQVYDMGSYFKCNLTIQLDRPGTGNNTAFS